MARRTRRRNGSVKRRNPIARAVRTSLFRVRRQRSRKAYTRKPKHRRADPAQGPEE